ncbi:pyruvate kinase [Enterobacteriaceae bacterium ET-AT1-13]|nr:pyruvate kinase [Enterobacteriaceae bacterium ET-AT1-13]WGS66481.1 pyruvate kinase [Enterobacteriaceae bacterium Cmel17]WMC17505.1 MAG: pyruvate kinase [Enterobacteriaceae bacterium Cmel21]WMC17712.1 MAG: pyruvate kinase [Enterobacteriaceae bacterium PSmelAO3-2]WMC17916.1 MAG: pyruvate kinase [Enterobacteriaceae bacterium PSmelAO3-1]WMC18119.1 MAG: pyruvate kinase [Enterobacteriaceae bacterium PSmelAO1]
MSRFLRKTKIIATLGPTTDKNNNLEKIILAGVNVVRLNFSHGFLEDHKIRAKKVKEISRKTGKYIAILVDLQGPKIRISSFKNGFIKLNINNIFILDYNVPVYEGNVEKVGFEYKNLINDVIPGDILVLDDGHIKIKVIKVKNEKIFTKVILGGLLSNNKGINKLGGGISAKSLTNKDKRDIIMASKIGIDYLAVSFPRSELDIKEARFLSNQAGSRAKIISKIERAEVVNNDKILDNIILSSDAVMVARGDLGVEIGDPELIGVQKKIISRSRFLNRAVITATQMMNSMINTPIPTRAEVMDVANSVLDGTDAVMLSAETATGKYPIETVKIMSNICIGAEKIPIFNDYKKFLNIQFNCISDAIAISSVYIANHLKGVAAIITLTESGRTSFMMSRVISDIPIFAISCHKNVLRLASLYRGVTPIYYDNQNIKNSMLIIKNIIRYLSKKKILFTGDLVVITTGDIIGKPGNTNTSRILCVK